MPKNVKYSVKYLQEWKVFTTFARYFETLCPYWVNFVME